MSWTKGPVLWIRAGRERSGVIFVLRKSLGNAVVRNRVRRRLRHICRELPAPTDVSLVVFAQPAASTASFGCLRDELRRLVAMLGLSRPAS